MRTEEVKFVAMLLLLDCWKTVRMSLLVIMLEKIRRNRSVKITKLLVNLLSKMDSVSKNLSKGGKKLILGGVLRFLHFY